MNEIILTSEMEIYELFKKSDEILVEFIKKDNSKRLMKCTLNQLSIPQNQLPKTERTKEEKEKEVIEKKIIRVYDLEKDAWRTIPLDRINWIRIDNQFYKIDFTNKNYFKKEKETEQIISEDVNEWELEIKHPIEISSQIKDK